MSGACLSRRPAALGLWARVVLAVDVAQAGGGDVGVNLCGADAYMAEEFLDDTQVGAMVQQMGGEAVS